GAGASCAWNKGRRGACFLAASARVQDCGENPPRGGTRYRLGDREERKGYSVDSSGGAAGAAGIGNLYLQDRFFERQAEQGLPAFAYVASNLVANADSSRICEWRGHFRARDRGLVAQSFSPAPSNYPFRRGVNDTGFFRAIGRQ